MRRVFAGLSYLLLLLVAAEFFFAASGAFSTAPHAESFRPHHALGYVIFTLPLVMALVAALARLPRRLIRLCVSVAGLTTFQVVIAKLARSLGGEAGPLLFGLHAIGALATIAVAVAIARPRA